MKVQFICLAKSRRRRPDGICIAGIGIGRGKWFRPIKSNNRALERDDIVLDNGAECKLLDVIEVDVSDHEPLDYQPENWSLEETGWKYLRHIETDHVYKKLKPFFSNNGNIFGFNETSKHITAISDRPVASSLALIEPKEVSWKIVPNSDKTEKRVRALFKIKDVNYNLTVTDTNWESRYSQLSLGEYSNETLGIGQSDTILFTISLSGPHWQSGLCTKLVAGVIHLPSSKRKAEVKLRAISSSSNLIKLNATNGKKLGTYKVGTKPCAVYSNKKYVWVAHQDNNNVTWMSARDGHILSIIPVGKNPEAICYDGKNIWVANSGSNNVTKIRASNGVPVGYYPVGEEPFDICYSGGHIWVANKGSNDVTKLRASNGAKVGRYEVGREPHSICFDGKNIWVANRTSRDVTKLKASNGDLLNRYEINAEPNGLCFDGKNIWVAIHGSNSIAKIRARDGALPHIYRAGAKPWELCSAGNNIWVIGASDTVAKIHARDGEKIGSWQVGSNLWDICFDGKNIWVVDFGAA